MNQPNPQELNPEQPNPEQPNPNPEKKKRKSKKESQDFLFSIDNEKINQLKENYTDEKNKNKKVRRTKSVIEAENKKLEQAQSFASTFSISAHLGLNILIKRISPNQPLTDEEIKTFDEAFSQVVIKYFDSISKFGEEVNLIFILGLITFPRFVELKKNKEKEKIKATVIENATEKTA